MELGPVGAVEWGWAEDAGWAVEWAKVEGWDEVGEGEWAAVWGPEPGLP